MPERQQIEYRDFSAHGALKRGEGDTEKDTLSGYAAVFEQPIDMWGEWREVISRGAFAKTINDGADVYGFWNHNDGEILGRRKNKTLTVSEDEHGLAFWMRPPKTQRGIDTLEQVHEDYIDKMSFGFWVTKEELDTSGELPLRRINEVHLIEISLVPIPAYEGTEVKSNKKVIPACIREYRAQITAGNGEPGPAPHSTEPPEQLATVDRIAIARNKLRLLSLRNLLEIRR